MAPKICNLPVTILPNYVSHKCSVLFISILFEVFHIVEMMIIIDCMMFWLKKGVSFWISSNHPN